jgi:hypothetical protein
VDMFNLVFIYLKELAGKYLYCLRLSSLLALPASRLRLL